MKARTGFRRLALALVLLAVAAMLRSAAPAAPGTTADPWRVVRGLLGRWEGEVRGEPGVGKAEREYRFVLKDRFIRVTNRSTYPPQARNPKGETHEDEGFISYDKRANRLVLRQFHVEGFVNQYVLESVSGDGRTLVFVTTAIENIPPGWRARETYRFVKDDELVETFALAKPGQDFVT